MNPLINDNIDRIKALCRQHKVDKIYVFGSVLTDDFSPHSDVDFLVNFFSFGTNGTFYNYFDFKESLEKLLKPRVDLVVENTLKNPYFIKSVNENKTLIYDAGGLIS